jgi:5-deoxy-glucuronate isomerase
MPDLLLKNHAPAADGLVHEVTPETAGWGHVGFAVYRLAPGQRLERPGNDQEHCLVILEGRCTVEAGPEIFRTIGGRDSPFKGKPTAVYIPWRTAWAVIAESDLELAVCTAPGGGDHKTRLIRPEDVKTSTRGTATNTRHVADILPETEPAHSLLVVEVVTPSGCWSSYPSHKHDTDNLPHESQLEETYYHRFDPACGFGFQRVYTDDRSLDRTMTIEDGDVVLVPEGYHPCATAHGYDLYYLNVMAGPKRVWKFNTEECHRWLLA